MNDIRVSDDWCSPEVAEPTETAVESLEECRKPSRGLRGWLGRNRRYFPTRKETGFLVLLILLGTFFFIDQYQGFKQRQLGGCEGNLVNLSTALDMYANDNAAFFPPKLQMVCPLDIPALPNCPGAGRVTYSYTVSKDALAYTLWCEGANHDSTGLPADFPRYTSHAGMTLR